MAAKKNAAAQDLRTPKYRPRIVKNLKKAYLRRPMDPRHPAIGMYRKCSYDMWCLYRHSTAHGSCAIV
jgi:hypothetical protein